MKHGSSGKGKGKGKGGKGKGKGKGKGGKGKGGRRGDGPEPKRPSDDGARPEPSKRRKIRDHRRISEAEVGITQRLCPDVPRFRGVLKSRWTDFIVHEIAPDGQVTHLTNLNVDDAVRRDNFAKPKAAASDGAIAEGLEQLRELSSASDHGGFTAFYALVQRYEADRTEESRKSIPVEGFVYQQQHEKAERTRFHGVFKAHFPSLVSDTMVQAQGEGAQTCHLRVRHAGRVQNADRRSQPKWPEALPEYLHFTLFKTQFDTLAALSLLANRVSVPLRHFNIAGTKDKRGVTCQRVSVRKVFAESLVQVQRALPSNVKVGNFAYRADRLNLGSLFGNRFTVVLRDVQGLDEAGVQAALQSLKEYGFVNYFGMQRFGTTSIPTYTIGVAIVNRDYQKAIELVLASRMDMDADDFAAAMASFRKALADKDAGARHEARQSARDAAEKTPRWMKVERLILEQLAAGDGGLNFGAAVFAIPRHLRMMYVHSLQSFAWNFMASRRIERYGKRVVVGDLVLIGEQQEADVPVDDEAEGDCLLYDDNREAQDEQQQRRGMALPKVKVVGCEADAQQYTLDDVVMTVPGPGAELQFPSHCCDRDAYRAFLTESGAEALLDGLGNAASSDYAVHGAYRKLINRPLDFSWDVRSYTSSSEDLTTTDWDVLKLKLPVHQSTDAGPALPEDAATTADGTGARGDTPASPSSGAADAAASYTAAVLHFSLPSSTYATMLVREVCVDQSFEAVRALAVAGAEQPEADGAAEAGPDVGERAVSSEAATTEPPTGGDVGGCGAVSAAGPDISDGADKPAVVGEPMEEGAGGNNTEDEAVCTGLSTASSPDAAGGDCAAEAGGATAMDT